MRASALDKVVTFAGEALFERKHPTSIKPEATLGERSDLRVSCQPEVPCTQKKTLISSLTKQVLNSPDKSTMIAELIKNNAQEKTEQVQYCHIKIQRFMLNKTATWNDMKFQGSTIVCDATNAQDTKDQAKHFAVVVVCCAR